MSRAFVKEDAPEPDENPPEKPLSELPNYCTPRGLKLYQDEEARLLAELEGLAGAQEDPARRKRKRELERDLRWVRARLEAAIPVDPANQPKEQIRFGATVLLRGEDGTERRLVIVGEDEAAEGGDFIAWSAPFVQAMLGLEKSREFEWNGRWTVVSLVYNA
jgi:transcription elongation factor GreB